MRVVLDTNVIISAFHFGGSVREVIDVMIARQDDWIISPFILSEVDRVLAVKLQWSGTERHALKQWLASHSETVMPNDIPQTIAADPDEDNILAAAAAGKADVIVSGDSKHLLPLKNWHGILIMSPHDFINYA